jgi:hypothetical protein
MKIVATWRHAGMLFQKYDKALVRLLNISTLPLRIFCVCIRGHVNNTDQYAGLSLLHIREPCVELMPFGFKTKPNTYSLDLAPSARARCRGCKQVIGKGEVRVVTYAFVRPNRGTYFVRHVECATSVFMTAVLKAHGSIECVPISGDMDGNTVVSTRALLQKLCV